jgi:hypothetical protein
MKNTHTAPLEVLAGKPNGEFTTEPYEAGWADEALLFAYVREAEGPSPRLALRVQLSADGIRWLDAQGAVLEVRGAGGGVLPLREFGNWLRVAGTVSGGPPDNATTVVIDLYWVLKG